MQQRTKTILSIAIMGIAAKASAGSFSLYTEGSAAAVGNYAAGIAAEGMDASIGYYNPAGLILLDQQEIVLSAVGVLPRTNLMGTSTFATVDVLPYQQSFSGLQGGKNAAVPAIHYALPLDKKATFGLSIYTPFGLATDWGESSPVRYAATLTDLLTVNVSPELGGVITEHFSVGAGLDLQWAEVKFNQVIGSPAEMQFLHSIGGDAIPTTLDSLSLNKGHSFGIGFHAGVLEHFNNNHSRVGINYQSRIKQQFNGYSLLTGRLADSGLTDPNATFRSNALFSNPITLPDITTLSIYQDLTPRLALLGSIVYTNWSTFNVIQLNRAAAYSSADSAPALVDSTSPEDYKNAWRFALGANYHFNAHWMLRIGGGYDETPTINLRRDVRLPDANRYAVSIGGHYQPFQCLGFDIGYTYLWAAEDPTLNYTIPLGSVSTDTIVAKAKVHAQLLGLQAVWQVG